MNLIKKTSQFLSLTAVTLCLVSAAHADDKVFPEPRVADKNTLAMDVGLLGGFTDPIGQLKPAISWGGDFGIQPVVPFSIGIQAFHFASHDSSTPTNTELQRTSILFKGAYNFGGENFIVKSTFIGVKAGALFDKTTKTTLSVSNETNIVRFGLAPMLGMDFPIVPHLTVGAEFSYLIAFGPQDVNSNVDNWNAFLTGKYWF